METTMSWEDTSAVLNAGILDLSVLWLLNSQRDWGIIYFVLYLASVVWEVDAFCLCENCLVFGEAAQPSGNSFVFQRRTSLLVASFLLCISSNQPGLIKRGSKGKSPSRNCRKQNYGWQGEANLCVMSLGAQSRWGKWKEVVWQIFNKCF